MPVPAASRPCVFLAMNLGPLADENLVCQQAHITGKAFDGVYYANLSAMAIPQKGPFRERQSVIG